MKSKFMRYYNATYTATIDINVSLKFWVGWLVYGYICSIDIMKMMWGFVCGSVLWLLYVCTVHNSTAMLA